MISRSKSLKRHAPFFALVLMGLFCAAQAGARPENLRWTHSIPNDVQRFEARVSSLDGSSSSISDLGVPSRDSNNIYTTTVEAGDIDVRIEIRALGPGLVASAWTPSQLRLAPSGSGGTGGGGTGGGSGGGGGGGSSIVPVGEGTAMTPTIGADARFDFNSNPLGTNVASWVDTGANYSLSQDDALFDVVQLGSNRILHTDSTQDDIHSHVDGASNVRSNFVLRGRMATDDPDATIGVTTYSQYSSEDRYYRLLSTSGGSFVLDGRPAFSCSSIDTGVAPVAGSWIQFELDVMELGGQSLIRAKVWQAGAAKPSAFQAECTDLSAGRALEGTIGVYAGGSGQKYWDDLEIIEGEPVVSTPPAPPILLQIVPVTQ